MSDEPRRNLRYYFRRVCLTLVACVFWPMIAMGLFKYWFGLTEDELWLYVGFPIALVLAVWLWKKLPTNI
jgi:hypothetical protein